MDIVIMTAEPDSIDVEAVRAAVEALGYYVASVTVDGARAAF